jgi:1,3-beta-glucanosyltransferase GAS4
MYACWRTWLTQYQPGGSGNVGVGSFDPLADTDACARDIFLMQQLGVNTSPTHNLTDFRVRIYSVDPTQNHDVCMAYLAAAGIYLILDVNTPLDGQNLNRYEPWTTYTAAYMTHVFSVIEAFKGYPNTLAMFAGNEVINDNVSAAMSPRYQKAVIRDMKDYIAKHVSRPIPVGYSAADDLKVENVEPKLTF